MKYDPAKATNVLPPGDYPAVIDSAKEMQSKSGKDMIKIILRIYTKTGSAIVSDYFVEASLWKLKQLAKAIGVVGSFESGEFIPEDYVGQHLTVTLKIEEDDSFGDHNKIKIYKKKGLGVRMPLPLPETPEVDDQDVPF